MDTVVSGAAPWVDREDGGEPCPVRASQSTQDVMESFFKFVRFQLEKYVKWANTSKQLNIIIVVLLNIAVCRIHVGIIIIIVKRIKKIQQIICTLFQIFNCDETGWAGWEKSCARVVGPKKGHLVSRQPSKPGGHITAHICVSAAGKFLPTLLMFSVRVV